MKILVCITKVPDTTTKIQFTDNNTQFDENGVTWIMNPTDEWYALVRAIEVKEKHGGTVTAINVGDASNDQVIRKALAIGADDAVRIDAQPADAYFVAAQIAEYAKQNGFNMIFTGKETINFNSGIVGGMIAELLDWPNVAIAEHMDFDGSKATITREIEGGSEKVEVSAPFVISANKGLAEQRIPNMRGIMMARKKPLNVVPAFNDVNTLTGASSFVLPPARSSVKLMDDAAALVKALHEEAKAI